MQKIKSKFSFNFCHNLNNLCTIEVFFLPSAKYSVSLAVLKKMYLVY